MIVRERPSGLRLFFTVKGSVVPAILPKIAATTLLAMAVTVTHGQIFHSDLTFTALPFTLIGLALSIFLGFRNSVAYNRYWEGRTLWGAVLICSRTFVRQLDMFFAVKASDGLDDLPLEAAWLRRVMILKVAAFTHAMRHHLRGTDPRQELERLLPADEVEPVMAARNRADAILRSLGLDIRTCLDRGWLQEYPVVAIDHTLNDLTGALGGCERIKNTPIPFAYTLLLHRTAYLYCFLLPFGLIDTVGMMTPVVVALLSYTFFGLDALGDEIEEPFGTLPNDLPLTALCIGIETGLQEALGEDALPLPAVPDKDYCLL